MSAYVEVNEARVHAAASESASEVWTRFRNRADDTGRTTVVAASIGGDRVRIACDDHTHARMLRSSLVSAGLPESSVAVGLTR